MQELSERYLDPKDAYLTCVGVLDDALLSDVRLLNFAELRVTSTSSDSTKGV